MTLYRAAFANASRPVGTPGNILGTDEQGRDMLSRLLFGGRKSLTAGRGASVRGPAGGVDAGHCRRLHGRLGEYADYAHDGYLLCLSLSPARHCHLRGAWCWPGEYDHRTVHCLYPAYYACGGEHHDAGTRLGVYGGRTRQWGRPVGDHAASDDRQRAGTDFCLCQHPGQCQRHPCLRPELPGARSLATASGVGHDAQYTPAIDLCQCLGACAARRDDFSDLHGVQLAQRWLARCHGCATLKEGKVAQSEAILR